MRCPPPHMPLIMFKYSFASFKLREHLVTASFRLKNILNHEFKRLVLFTLFALLTRVQPVVYIYDCSVSWVYVSHISHQLEFTPTNQLAR